MLRVKKDPLGRIQLAKVRVAVCVRGDNLSRRVLMVAARVAETVALGGDSLAKIEAVGEVVNLQGGVIMVHLCDDVGGFDLLKLSKNRNDRKTSFSHIVVGDVAADLNLKHRHVVVVAAEREGGLAGAVGSLRALVLETILHKRSRQVR